MIQLKYSILSHTGSFDNMIHIGEKIKEFLLIRKLSVAEFARQINTDRNNAYHIFKRKSIDTEQLYKICIILNHDFFQYYKPIGEEGINIANDDFSMPDRLWFAKQFKSLINKIDKLKK